MKEGRKEEGRVRLRGKKEEAVMAMALGMHELEAIGESGAGCAGWMDGEVVSSALTEESSPTSRWSQPRSRRSDSL